MGDEVFAPIGNDVARCPVFRENFPEKDSSEGGGVNGFSCGKEVSHFREAVNHDKDAIESLAFGKAFNEVHRDGMPRSLGNWEES